MSTPSVRLRLRIGVLGDGLGSLTWPLLSAFGRERPDVDIVLTPMGFLEAFQAIDAGRADVVLATGPLTPTEHRDVISVDAESIAALFTSGHPLASEWPQCQSPTSMGAKGPRKRSLKPARAACKPICREPLAALSVRSL